MAAVVPFLSSLSVLLVPFGTPPLHSTASCCFDLTNPLDDLLAFTI